MDTEKDKDYYFMIIGKKAVSKTYWVGLKEIATLVPNGNNLPFQSDWSKNQIPVERTHDEAKRFILDALKSSIILRSQIQKDFEAYFKEV